jgi:phosphoserine aminotransferase
MKPLPMLITAFGVRRQLKEAKLFGNVNIVSSTKDKNHSYIAKDFSIPADAKYLHFTTNNTVEGTEWHHIPETNVPLVADMSSDIFSRPFNYSKFALDLCRRPKKHGCCRCKHCCC